MEKLTLNLSSLQTEIVRDEDELMYVDHWPRVYGFSLEEILIFQLFITYDFLIGNQDRHDKNWLIVLDDQGNLLGIIGIDNGGALPEKQLTSGRSDFIEKNQYAWATLPLSRIHLLPHRWNVLSIVSMENIECSFKNTYNQLRSVIANSLASNLINETEGREGDALLNEFFNNDNMKHCLKQRLEILKRCSYPEDLAKHKTEKQFEANERRKKLAEEMIYWSVTGPFARKNLTPYSHMSPHLRKNQGELLYIKG